MNSPKNGRLSFGILFIVLLWWVLSLALNRPIVPGPMVVGVRLANLLVEYRLWADAGASLGRVLLGLGFSAILGVPIGLFIGRTTFGQVVLRPAVYLAFPVPKIGFLPVFLVLFGLGNSSKVILLTTVMVFQLIIPVADQVRQIPRQYFLAAQVLGLRGWHLYRHLILPSIASTVLSSLKLAAGIGFSVLFFAENYGTRFGLGAFIMNAWVMADYGTMYAGIVALGLTGIGVFLFLDWLSGRLVRG